MYCFKINLANTPSNNSNAGIMFDSTSPEYANDWYIRVRVKLERQSVQTAQDNAVNNVTLTVGTSTYPASYTCHKTAGGPKDRAEAIKGDTATATINDTDYTVLLYASYTAPATKDTTDGTYKFWVTAKDCTLTAGTYELDTPIKLTGYTTDGMKTVPFTITKITVDADSTVDSSWSGESTTYGTKGSSFNVNKVEPKPATTTKS